MNIVRFTLDDWMVGLFGPDLNDPTDWDWISERATRCENRILETALELANTGSSSVIEIGLAQAKRRAEVAAAIRKRGAGIKLHYLKVDPAERWRRVEERNRTANELGGLTIPRPIFDFFEARWQPPRAAELEALDALIVDGSPAP